MRSSPYPARMYRELSIQAHCGYTGALMQMDAKHVERVEAAHLLMRHDMSTQISAFRQTRNVAMRKTLRSVAVATSFGLIVPALIMIAMSLVGTSVVWMEVVFPAAMNVWCCGMCMLSTLPVNVDAFFADHLWMQSAPYMLTNTLIFLAVGFYIDPIWWLGVPVHFWFFVSGCRLRSDLIATEQTLDTNPRRLGLNDTLNTRHCLSCYVPSWSEVALGLNGVSFNLSTAIYCARIAARVPMANDGQRMFAVGGHLLIGLVALIVAVQYWRACRCLCQRRIEIVHPEATKWLFFYCWIFFSGCQMMFIFCWAKFFDVQAAGIRIGFLLDFVAGTEEITPVGTWLAIGVGWAALAVICGLNRSRVFRAISAPFEQSRHMHDGAFIAALLAGSNIDSDQLLIESSERFRRLSFSNITLELFTFSPREASSGQVSGSKAVDPFSLSEPCELGDIDCFITHSWSDDPKAKYGQHSMHVFVYLFIRIYLSILAVQLCNWHAFINFMHPNRDGSPSL